MKKITAAVFLIVILLLLTSVSCVSVKEIMLNPVVATRAVGDTVTLEVFVLPQKASNRRMIWNSSNDAVAVVKNGVVTARTPGYSTITARTKNRRKTATCVLTVVMPNRCNVDRPKFGDSFGTVSFKTDQTWKVGSQEWSDVVMASHCNTTTFNGGDNVAMNYNADCRSNRGYGDLFSWCAVTRFQNQLCPYPWRVPAKDDFVALDLAMGGTGEFRAAVLPFIEANYLNPAVWGGTYGGRSFGYWTLTEYDATNGFFMYLTRSGVVYPQAHHTKLNGFQVRCVR